MTWRQSKPERSALCGQQVLVVEDEPVVALELAMLLADEGADVVGPCSDVAAGLRLARDAPISAALLDVRLGRQTIAPVARTLARRGIPFLFYSGQVETDEVRREWPNATFIPKPAPARSLVAALRRLNKHPTHA